MKLEKDARDSQEAAIQRRRQDELRQQIALQQQQHQQQRMQQVQNVVSDMDHLDALYNSLSYP